MSIALGYIFERVMIGKVTLLLIFTAPMFFFLLLFSTSRFVSLLLGSLFSLLLPLSMITNGIFKASLIDVFITSNIQEAYQFYFSMPSMHTIPSIVLFLVFFISIFCNLQIKYKKNKIVIPLTIGITILSLSIFLFKVRNSLVEIKEASINIYTHSLPKNEWKIKGSTGIKQYNTYIVIIGESMRRDFMSLYGFSLETTPFIDQLPKKYITNYITTAVNTTLSVPRILSKTDKLGNIQEQNNVINLAKKAGYYTYWISYQGYNGKYNIASSRIAQNANFLFFDDGDDYDLLPIIKEKIFEEKKKKVIFVHIMGSHEDPYKRLYDYGVQYNTGKGKLIDCYLSTYRKTDDFIKEIFMYLKESGESFSVSYFSDHGLNFVDDLNGFSVFRDDHIKQSYQVPFFVASSDDIASLEVNVTHSAYHYLDFFASWIGVKTNMTIDDYNIFSNESDDPFVLSYEKKLIPYSKQKEGIASEDLFGKHKK